MKNLNNDTATTPTFTSAQYAQLHRYNEITDKFFGNMGSSDVFTDLLELYKYMEESGLIEGVDDKATSEIKLNYLYTIQKLGAFVADLERNHAFFKNKL